MVKWTAKIRKRFLSLANAVYLCYNTNEYFIGAYDMELQVNQKGEILTIRHNGMTAQFTPENHFGFGYEWNGGIEYVTLQPQGNGYVGVNRKIEYFLCYETLEDSIKINVKIKNASGYDFFVDKLLFSLAVDSYMAKYPDWREKYFPTLLRVEKTHFYGYFQTPNGNALVIAGEKGIPSYDISYAHPATPHRNDGHRIYNTSLHLFNREKTIARAPKNRKVLKVGETYENSFYLTLIDNIADLENTVNRLISAPVIHADKYTVEKGEKLAFDVVYNGKFRYTFTAPSGKKYENEIPPTDTYGIYTLNVIGDNGYKAESVFFVRKSWDFYLLGAAKEALQKPQKATTHTESWYGFFSLFLAQKHYPNAETFRMAMQHFQEVMPLCFDFERANPLVIPQRIQNVSAFISLLVDLYETNPQKHIDFLRLASLYGDFLIKNQTADGVYRRGNVHYTCVIYVAKSMLELVAAERNCNDKALRQKAETHYQSAKRAVDELVLHLDNIDTEGELTFEDGMISCSALQIAYFALTLPENERQKYVEASEKMIQLHACLEQQHAPDCRMNGGSIRFWESQYDVMIRGNTVNSPHGWTAWTLYAYYYLYLLTGKREYLVRLMNGVCACAQLLSLDGELRWAFFSQPFVKLPTLVPDKTKPVKDGYPSVVCTNKAYRGKYQTKTYGEQYVDMISGWYRTNEQKINGGYAFCPLITETEYLYVDNQGGCCDNDVHEIFKCIEETVLKKAFVYHDHQADLYYGAAMKNGILELHEEVCEIVYSCPAPLHVKVNGKDVVLEGVGTLKL